MVKDTGKTKVNAGEVPRWKSMLLISAAYVAVIANIQGFMALLPLVQDEFGISRAEAGLYTSLYFLSATVLAMYSGRLVDRLGVQRSMFFGVTLVGIMIVLHSFSPTFGAILLLAFFTGVGFSFITPSVNKGALAIAETGKKALYMGLAHSGAGVGAFIGAALMPYIGAQFDWRTPLMWGGVLAVIIALIILKFGGVIPGGAEEEKKEGEKEKEIPSFKDVLLDLLKNRRLLIFCIMGMVFGISISSITGHLSLYLTQDLGYSPFLAGLGLGLFQVGGIMGQPGWGLLNDGAFQGNRKNGLFLLGLMVALMSLFFGLVVTPMLPVPAVVLGLVFMLGFFTLGIPGIYFTAVGELVPDSQTGAATGLALIFNRVGVVFFPPLFGLVADWQDNYQYSWLLLGATVMLLSFLFLYLGKKQFRE